MCSFADDDSEEEVEEGRELPFDISLPAKHLVSAFLHLLLQDRVVVSRSQTLWLRENNHVVVYVAVP